jgi:hypothetical protein
MELSMAENVLLTGWGFSTVERPDKRVESFLDNRLRIVKRK